jgi:hypothetical protein
MIEVMRAPYENLPKLGKGEKDSYDDLVCWLQAVHVAHVDAGDDYDVDGYRFFFLWYCDLAE